MKNQKQNHINSSRQTPRGLFSTTTTPTAKVTIPIEHRRRGYNQKKIECRTPATKTNKFFFVHTMKIECRRHLN